MQVGMATIFQNPENQISDGEVYRNELRLANLAEPLGFDSIWGVEHHFTDYTMCPDVMQFLTYMAGRTKQIKLGSMVVVLPWHDPMRVAEEVSMLDHISEGRLILGMGRGAGRVEFEGFRVPMDESRERFVEAAQMVLAGLEQGYCEFNGKHYKQPRADIRPKPEKTFKGRTYAAAVSPESVEIMARLGIGILVIPQKPWPMVDQELAAYRDVFQKVNNAPAPAPIIAGWCFCDEDEKTRARKGGALDRRLLGDGTQALRIRRRALREDEGLRVLCRDVGGAARQREPDDRDVSRSAGLGHAEDVHRPHPRKPARRRSRTRSRRCSATPACRTTKLNGTCVCLPRRFCRCCSTTSSPLRPADRCIADGRLRPLVGERPLSDRRLTFRRRRDLRSRTLHADKSRGLIRRVCVASILCS